MNEDEIVKKIREEWKKEFGISLEDAEYLVKHLRMMPYIIICMLIVVLIIFNVIL